MLAERYRGCSYVTVVEPAAGGKLEPEALNDTNKLELSVHANETRRQAVLVARLDNLGKGASGAAVQNLQLMLGPSGLRSVRQPRAALLMTTGKPLALRCLRTPLSG